MMTPDKPFVKTVKTKKGIYCYDVNSGHILGIDNLVDDVLEHWEYYSENAPVVDDKHEEAYRHIKELQASENLFLAGRPSVIRPNIRPDDIDDPYECHLSHIILCVTESCNLDCSYCVYSGKYPRRRVRSGHNMPIEIARKAIGLLCGSHKKDKLIYLGFYGGEPLLRLDFIKKCVKYAKEAIRGSDLIFSITTNGVLISEKVARYLARNRFVVTVSLDGPAEIHDKNRHFAGGKGSFRRTRQGIENLLKAGGKEYFRRFVNINAVLTPPYNPGLLHEYFKKCDAIVRLSSLDYHPDIFKKGASYQISQWDALADGLKRHYLGENRRIDPHLAGMSVPYELFGRELKKIHNRQIGGHLKSPKKILGLCRPGEARAFVTCGGDIYVCERVEGNPDMLIGNVDAGVDKELVRSIIKEVNAQDFSRCRDCWILNFCPLCFAHLVYDGRIDEKKWRFICESYRSRFTAALRLYCEILEEDESALDILLADDHGRGS